MVAQEIARTARGDLFAPTPALEAFKYLISSLASRGVKGPGDHRMLVVDVRKAFFYAKMARKAFIRLPPPP